MNQDYVIFTMVYAINHEKGAFKMYVFTHTDGFFYSDLLYYNIDENLSSEKQIPIDLKLKKFRAKKVEDSINLLIEWLKANISGKFSVELIDSY